MGDRTRVTLTVLRSQAEKAQELFSEGYESEDTIASDSLLYSWEFDEVNYGHLPFLGGLKTAGIAYDSGWDNGDTYSSGYASCRFSSEGELVQKDLYDNEDSIPLSVLTRLLNEPETLRQKILDTIQERTVLPWDHQEEYGKLYHMKQLIT